MSGTSLDGLDICYCTFEKNGNEWVYAIEQAETIRYPGTIAQNLKNAPSYNAEQITELDYSYGRYIGKEVKRFIQQNKLNVDFIASHGHTIFHNPAKGYTLQIGKGSAIAAETGCACISDFRAGDVSRGGQGAPLVPVGDKLLFHQYDICLNLGGIANISYDDEKGNRLAYDIGPCNMLLNHLASKAGLEYDSEGSLGRKGEFIPEMLRALERLPYYLVPPPKSIGREWFTENIMPILEEFSDYPLTNMLRTAYEHIATRISSDCNKLGKTSLLATGGGAKNQFLMDLLREKTNLAVSIPDKKTVDFKEAMIFAFLGVLYLRGEAGALASVTGSMSDSITGCLYY